MPKIKTALLIGLVLTLSIALIGCAGLFSQEDEPVQPLEAGEEELPEWLLLASRQSESNDLRKDDNLDDLNDEEETEPVDEPTESADAPVQTEPAPQPAPSSSSGQQTVQPSQSTTDSGYTGEIGRHSMFERKREEAAKKAAEEEEDDPFDLFNDDKMTFEEFMNN